MRIVGAILQRKFHNRKHVVQYFIDGIVLQLDNCGCWQAMVGIEFQTSRLPTVMIQTVANFCQAVVPPWGYFQRDPIKWRTDLKSKDDSPQATNKATKTPKAGKSRKSRVNSDASD